MVTLLANAGLPMIFWQMPVAAVALLPIVLVESFIVMRIIERPFRRVIVRVLVANALSTFVGVPIAWGGMLVMNAVTRGTHPGFDTPWNAFLSVVLQASWLIPIGKKDIWIIPAATLVLLVPYLLISVFVERWLLRRQFREVDPKHVTRAAWIANAVSYGILAACTAFWLFQWLPGGSAE